MMPAASGLAAAADADVLVVGAGPVGLACALLLARRGWRVTVLERWPAPYAQPRAVHFDDEVARLLADAGLAGQLAQLTEPADIYEWRNGAGQTLLRFDWSGTGPSGWPAASMFHQPALEDALAAEAEAAGHVTVLRGYQAVQLTEAVDLRAAGAPPGDAPAAIDVDGTYLAYLGAAGAVAALIRPDHYLFGPAATWDDLPALVDDLRRQLAAPGTAGPARGSRAAADPAVSSPTPA